jgi:hypothetical protein
VTVWSWVNVFVVSIPEVDPRENQSKCESKHSSENLSAAIKLTIFNTNVRVKMDHIEEVRFPDPTAKGLGEGQDKEGFIHSASTCQDAELARKQADAAKLAEQREKNPPGSMFF